MGTDKKVSACGSETTDTMQPYSLDCSGSGVGMNLTKIISETGLVVDDSNLPERVGTEYFTDVIALNIEED